MTSAQATQAVDDGDGCQKHASPTCQNPAVTLPDTLRTWLDARRATLAEHGVAVDAVPGLDALLLASDYAFERLRRQPGALEALRESPAALLLPPDAELEWPARLRRYRHACSLRLIWRDVVEGQPLAATLAESSRIADHCAQAALDAVEARLAALHGTPRSREGVAQRLVVFGLGKLGGAELNFSSDIDLVFAFAEGGQSDGARALDNETWFMRAGQRLIQLLGDTTADGFGFRVDMRLRPFGSAGRLALSFAAMEQYFQREGRDWERYAWVKARPIAGDVEAGERMLEALRPFVYRRYLDFTAFEGLREMKAMIEAEVQRRDLAEHIKLGPGGIREIEFVVQLQQLIRGGREAALRTRGLLPALAALEAAGHLSDVGAARLREAYVFLRRLENRLQMLRDEQVHVLPEDASTRARLAAGLGFADWGALYAALEVQRTAVREEFERVFEARRRAPPAEAAAFAAYWRQIDREADAGMLAAAGFVDAGRAHAALRGFAAAAAQRGLSARGRSRLDRLIPALLAGVVRQRDPATTLDRLLRLLQAILGRTSYLALLDEQPAARERLVEVMARSALLAERLAAHPLLLDDLLDGRADAPPGDRDALAALWRVSAAGLPADDAEAQLVALNEFRQSVAFRIARVALLDRQPAVTSAFQLASLAEVVLDALLAIAQAEMERLHGRLAAAGAHAGIAVVGYGSLGGAELGFGSDLDLVFLFEPRAEGESSDGARPLDAGRYQLRLVQKLLALLATQTPAGRLYEADLRLRPDGAKGLLLCSLPRFEEYQARQAWAWEHQALVRARCVAGDPALGAGFEAIRRAVLGRPRPIEAVRADVAAMRARMRAELDRSRPGAFDLKQGEGGLVDLEFLLQAGVLSRGAARPALLDARQTPALLAAAAAAGWLDDDTAERLRAAHEALVHAALDCTLDARPRLVEPSPRIEAARAAVMAAWQAVGLDAASRPSSGDALN